MKIIVILLPSKLLFFSSVLIKNRYCTRAFQRWSLVGIPRSRLFGVQIIAREGDRRGSRGGVTAGAERGFCRFAGPSASTMMECRMRDVTMICKSTV